MGGLLMAKPITSLSITAPGFFGLNRQDADIDLPVGYALEANNCVIDRYGRLGSRKGWTKANTTSAELSTATVKAQRELITNAGVSYILCAGNDKLFKLSAGALVELTYGGGGSTPTISDSNWQMADFNGKMYFFQSGHDPLVFDPALSTTTYIRVTEVSGYVATVPSGNICLSAFGRIWTANTSSDKRTVAWSDILSGHVWSTGTSGTLDLSKVWVNGADEIVALAAHNNFLVIFGRRQILVYSGADDPSTMSLSDTINTIGCIARDSVQNTGSDLIFLSNSGVRSLSRTIQEKSAPLGDLSKNIRDHFISDSIAETESLIKSIYSELDSFYLLTMPTSAETYCFDTRQQLDNGGYRVTTWSLVPTSFSVSKSKKLYMGFAGYLGEHTGYLDDASTYVMEWFSTHFRLGEPNTSAILKKMNLVAIGGNGQTINVLYAFDYGTDYRSSSITLSNTDAAEYGIAEYGIGEYSMSTNLSKKGSNIGGAGKVVQIGLQVTINGYQVSFQKIDLFAKIGKIVM